MRSQHLSQLDMEPSLFEHFALRRGTQVFVPTYVPTWDAPLPGLCPIRVLYQEHSSLFDDDDSDTRCRSSKVALSTVLADPSWLAVNRSGLEARSAS